MRGLAHCANRIEWNSWFSAVNERGSKWSRVSTMSSLTARARRMSSVVMRRAASAVAVPSRMLRACMLKRYCESSTIDTWAPTFRSNVTSPSASSWRIASRTGTTLMSRSLAIEPSTSR